MYLSATLFMCRYALYGIHGLPVVVGISGDDGGYIGILNMIGRD